MYFKTKKQIKAFTLSWGSNLEPFQIDIIWKIESNSQITIVGMRQFGKTETITDDMIGAGLNGERSLYTSYDVLSVDEAKDRTFEKAEIIKAENPGLIKRINNSGSTPFVEFTSGGKIEFRARGTRIGRGFKVDRLYFDEAAQLSDQTYAKMLATIQNSKIAKVILIGTPPADEDYEKYGTETPFIQAYNQGDNPETKTILLDFGIGEYDPNLKLNIETVRKVNPLARRIPNFNKKQLQFMSKLSHKSYCVEFLGAWAKPKSNEIHEPHFTLKEVDSFLTKSGARGTRFTASVGVYPDCSKAFIAFSNGVITEIVEDFDITGGDMAELVEWLSQRAHKLDSIRIPFNQRGQTIEKMLKKKRIMKTEMLKVTETAVNITKFEKQVMAGSLKVFTDSDVRMALSSFWLGLIPSSGSYEILSGNSEDKAIVLALVNATKDGNIIKRNGPAMKVW